MATYSIGIIFILLLHSTQSSETIILPRTFDSEVKSCNCVNIIQHLHGKRIVQKVYCIAQEISHVYLQLLDGIFPNHINKIKCSYYNNNIIGKSYEI